MSDIARNRGVVFEDPPIARFLFNDTRSAWLWLIARIYVGYSWLASGWGKVGNPAWVDTGEALRGFWNNAVQIPPQGRPPITFDWYREFIGALLAGGHYSWFAKLIVFSELAIGAALIVGAFVGLAAFFGAFMNWNFLMAGTTSVNPVLFTLGVLLVLAWKVAGYYGLDRWLLPALGTPWRPGVLFGEQVPARGRPYQTEEEAADEEDSRAA
jgi:thiosulfate dehydrogenase [quinone] large subunit